MLYDKIKIIAKRENISINKLEKSCGLSKGSICKWNMCSPDIHSLRKVADELCVSIDKLLSD